MGAGKEVSKIVRYGSYIFIAAIALVDFLYAGFLAVIPAIIAVYCAGKNAEWASKIGKSANVAWLAGILLGLLGLLTYWIYYKIKTPKVKEVDSGVVSL